MLMRGGDQAEAFLDEVWAQSQFVHHKWWENAAVCHVLGYAIDPPRPARETIFSAGTKLISRPLEQHPGRALPEPPDPPLSRLLAEDSLRVHGPRFICDSAEKRSREAVQKRGRSR